MLSHPVFLQIFFETRNMTRTIFSRFWWFSISNWFPIGNLDFQLISNMKSLREFNTEWNPLVNPIVNRGRPPKVPRCGSWLWQCHAVSSLIWKLCAAKPTSIDKKCSVKASFVLWIYGASGIKIWRRIWFFNQKLNWGMFSYPTISREHFASSGPVSIR